MQKGPRFGVIAKAAALIGFKTGWAKTPEALAIANDLPEGKVFATGTAPTPSGAHQPAPLVSRAWSTPGRTPTLDSS